MKKSYPYVVKTTKLIICILTPKEKHQCIIYIIYAFIKELMKNTTLVNGHKNNR